jgi:hypothetical protein
MTRIWHPFCSFKITWATVAGVSLRQSGVVKDHPGISIRNLKNY